MTPPRMAIWQRDCDDPPLIAEDLAHHTPAPYNAGAWLRVRRYLWSCTGVTTPMSARLPLASLTYVLSLSFSATPDLGPEQRRGGG